jgi:phenylpropionate dioxygenase-like ring-hydroxylating dioxygenase large terminal subunit
MIPNQWYAVLEASEVPERKPIGKTRLGQRLVFWRDASGRVACFTEACPHRGAALSQGVVLAGRLQCPFHGFEFNSDGACACIPANGRASPVPRAVHAGGLACREAHGFIWVWNGAPLQAAETIPWFESIDGRFSHATLRSLWPVHYTRAIENQLDVVHLPFVHHNTIGRGQRTVVNGPLVRWESGSAGARRMNIWVYNTQDDGGPPRRAEELDPGTRHPSLQFQFPNIWHNWISESVRIMAAFAPVDNDHTMLYVRFYQNSVRTPILRDLFNWAAMPANALILSQDRRVVVRQEPRRTYLRMGEKLIQGDSPIIAFRRERDALQAAAGAAPPERA